MYKILINKYKAIFFKLNQKIQINIKVQYLWEIKKFKI